MGQPTSSTSRRRSTTGPVFGQFVPVNNAARSGTLLEQSSKSSVLKVGSRSKLEGTAGQRLGFADLAWVPSKAHGATTFEHVSGDFHVLDHHPLPSHARHTPSQAATSAPSSPQNRAARCRRIACEQARRRQSAPEPDTCRCSRHAFRLGPPGGSGA